MTWPTASITTANVDQGTDSPRLARAQIRSAIDNVNSIAAEFGNVYLDTAQNGQFLQRVADVWVAADGPLGYTGSAGVGYAGSVGYTGSSGSSAGTSTGTAYIDDTDPSSAVSASSTAFGTQSRSYQLVEAGGTGITVSGSNVSVPAGTYLFSTEGVGTANTTSSTAGEPRIQLYNLTDAAEIHSFNGALTGVASGPVYYYTIGSGSIKFTLTATKTLQFRYATTNGAISLDVENFCFKFTKIA